MLARIDLWAGVSYAAIGTYDVSDASSVSSRRLVASSIGHAYRTVRVAQQAEWEIELFCKGAVLFFGIEAHTKDFDILGGVLLGSITEPNTFDRSAGCVGFRIKPEHDGTASEVAEPHVFARVRSGREVRRGISNIEHDGPPGFQNFDESDIIPAVILLAWLMDC